MRHRRAERCVLRAELALDAGLEEEAFESLEEAERLNPGDPRVAALKIAVDERMAANMVAYKAAQQAADEAEHVKSRRRRRVVQLAAAAVLFLTVGVTAYWLTPSDLSTQTSPPITTSAPTAATPPATVGSNPGAPPSAPPTPLAEGRTEPPAPIATGGEVRPPVERSSTSPQDPERSVFEETARPVPLPPRTPPLSQKFGIPDPRQAASTPPATATSKTEPTATPIAAPPAPPEPATLTEPPSAPPAANVSLERMGERLATSNVPVPERRVPPPAPAPAPSDPPPDAAAAEEPRVRATLARYEAAYSGLNAAAAQAVWPGVDERSLARAFDTLQSQRVSLGRCSVQVQGTTATANCSGSISWTPKVGGRRQTEARQWRFELANSSGAWQITRAEAR